MFNLVKRPKMLLNIALVNKTHAGVVKKKRELKRKSLKFLLT